MISRRNFGISLAGLGLAAASAAVAKPAPTRRAGASAITASIAKLEARSGGRLGVAYLDLSSGATFGYRQDERFAMCSTFKYLAAAATLRRVDQGKERLDQRVSIKAADLLPHSPVTREHLADGMTLAQLCEAAITQSDNAAGNLLLARFGGPAGLTAFVRTLGDKVTRLDRMEPHLNSAVAGDPRDTTSPRAMLGSLKAVAVDDALSAASRAQLTAWLIANQTGDKRIRAGLPKNWRVGDKTGTGANGTYNDLAIAWPPQGKPVLITTYLTGATCGDDAAAAILADAARRVTAPR